MDLSATHFVGGRLLGWIDLDGVELRQFGIGQALQQAPAAELEEAWRTFLQDRWELSPGTPSTHWRLELERHGADPKASEELEKMSEDLHYLRYAPQLSSTEALQHELVQRSRQILKSLH